MLTARPLPQASASAPTCAEGSPLGLWFPRREGEPAANRTAPPPPRTQHCACLCARSHTLISHLGDPGSLGLGPGVSERPGGERAWQASIPTCTDQLLTQPAAVLMLTRSQWPRAPAKGSGQGGGLPRKVPDEEVLWPWSLVDSSPDRRSGV